MYGIQNPFKYLVSILESNRAPSHNQIEDAANSLWLPRYQEIATWLTVSVRELRYISQRPWFPSPYSQDGIKAFRLAEIATWYLEQYEVPDTSYDLALSIILGRWKEKKNDWSAEHCARLLVDTLLEKPVKSSQAAEIINQWTGRVMSPLAVKRRAQRIYDNAGFEGLERFYYYGSQSNIQRGCLRFPLPGVIRYADHLSSDLITLKGGKHE